MARNSEKIEFEGHDGDTLAARLDLPEGKPRAYALFAHCFSCSKDVFAAARVSKGLTDHGIACLRFDFTGLGHSEGEFENTNFTSNVEDLLCASDFLRDEHEAPKLIVGHSLGGAAVLAMAGKVKECEGVVTINAPCDPEHVAGHFADAVEKIREEGEAEVDLGGRTFTIKKHFIEDIAEQKMQKAIKGLKKPLLVFHAPMDKVVGIDSASRIFAAAKHPKSFVSLDDADHLLTDKDDAAYVADVISAWASRYLDVEDNTEKAEKAEKEAETTIEGEEGAIIVTEAGSGKFTQNISAHGRHALKADEPEDYGGDDTGPSPYDFLLAGLGACTGMTLRMYAEHKDLPLDKVSVKLTHKKIHAEDCKSCETKEGKIDRIEREITIEGDLDKDQRKRLLEIADKCPVHRTLHSEVEITTKETS